MLNDTEMARRIEVIAREVEGLWRKGVAGSLSQPLYGHLFNAENSLRLALHEIDAKMGARFRTGTKDD